MSVYGLTGSLASGKTTVLNLLKNKGAKIYDLDKEVHALYEDRKSKVYKQIVQLFPEVINNDGQIIRSKLGGVVFKDKIKLAKLEKIVHPLIIKKLKDWIRENKKRDEIFIAEVPLLFEKNLEKLFSKVILIRVKRGLLVKRIEGKLGLSKQEINRRLALYLAMNIKIKKADFVLNNDKDLKALIKGVDKLWEELKKINIL